MSFVGIGFSLLWMAVAFFVLRFVAKRIFAETGRADIAALAVVLAFAAGAIWPLSQLVGSSGGPVAAAPPPADAPALPATDVVPGKRDVSGRCRASAKIAPAGVGNLDVAHTIGNPVAINDGDVLATKAGFVLEGWAASVSRERLASAVCLVVDGHVSQKAVVTYGGPRPDVVTALHASTLLLSAFQIVVPGGAIASGRHKIAVAAQSQGRGFNLIPGVRTIELR